MATSRLPSHVLRKVAKDLQDICKSPPEGITVIPNEEDMTEILARIAGPGSRSP
jgi:ubiquitin-protein ligase